MINSHRVTRVISADRSEDLIQGDYVLADLNKQCNARGFYSEVDIFDKNGILEEVERIITKNKAL